MPGLYASLVFLHLTGAVVWIGSILAVVVVLSADRPEPAARGTLGVHIYKKLSIPGFLVAFAAGTLRLVLSPGLYFVDTKFMHGKLFLVLLVIVLHHLIGGRAKRMATGAKMDAGITPTLAVVLLVSAVGAVFFAVIKPF